VRPRRRGPAGQRLAAAKPPRPLGAWAPRRAFNPPPRLLALVAANPPAAQPPPPQTAQRQLEAVLGSYRALESRLEARGLSLRDVGVPPNEMPLE
jgi:hypothetical protein